MNYMSYAEVTLACTIAAFAGGWGIGHFGVSALTVELAKLRTELESIKNRMFPSVQTTTVSPDASVTTVTTN